MSRIGLIGLSLVSMSTVLLSCGEKTSTSPATVTSIAKQNRFYIVENGSIFRGTCTAGQPPSIETCKDANTPSMDYNLFKEDLKNLAYAKFDLSGLNRKLDELKSSANRYETQIAELQQVISSNPQDPLTSSRKSQLEEYKGSLAQVRQEISSIEAKIKETNVDEDLRLIYIAMEDTMKTPHNWDLHSTSPKLLRYFPLFDEVFTRNGIYPESSSRGGIPIYETVNKGGTLKIKFQQKDLVIDDYNSGHVRQVYIQGGQSYIRDFTCDSYDCVKKEQARIPGLKTGVPACFLWVSEKHPAGAEYIFNSGSNFDSNQLHGGLRTPGGSFSASVNCGVLKYEGTIETKQGLADKFEIGRSYGTMNLRDLQSILGQRAHADLIVKERRSGD